MNISKPAAAKAVLSAAITVAAIVFTFSLSGCGEELTAASPERSSLVYCVQKTTNTPGYSSFAQERIEEAQQSHSSFQAVVIDGDPFVVFPEAATLGKEGGNADNVAAENAAQLSNIQAALCGVKGKTPEADVIEALYLADRIHAAAGVAGTTVIYSTGLATQGALDLTGEGMLGVGSNELIPYLDEAGYSFSNTQLIEWYGFGDVAGAQEDLTHALEKSLKLAYEETLTGLGAGSVVFREDLPSGDESLADCQPAITAIDVPDYESIEDVGGTTKLPSETLPFVADSAEFVDRENALSAIKPFAEAMSEDEGLVATVAGSTAGYPWDKESAYQLGLERAQAVADVLSSFGINSSRIRIISYGDEAPDHVVDIDESTGLQIPNQAVLNRWVSISLE